MLNNSGLFFFILLTLFSFTAVYAQNLWSVVLGGSLYDQALTIAPSVDNNFLVGGEIDYSPDAGSNAFLLKISPVGDTLWLKEYGTETGQQRFYSLLQNDDGTIAALGYTKNPDSLWYNMWFVKTNAEGDTLFTRSYGNEAMEWGLRIKKVSDGYFLLGFTQSVQKGDTDILLIKISENGDIVRSRNYGGAENDWGADLIFLPDSGMLVGGFTESQGNGKRDAWLLRLNQQGDTVWTKTYGNAGDDWIRAMCPLHDGNVILAGSWNESAQSQSDAWLCKVDTLGNIIWETTFGGDSADNAYSTVLETQDGNFAFIGSTNSYGSGSSDMFFVITDSLGNSKRVMAYGKEGFESGSALTTTSDGGFILVGSTDGVDSAANQGQDIWIVKTDSLGKTNKYFTGGIEKPNTLNSFTLFNNYPNPFNPSTTIEFFLPHKSFATLTIYNTPGQEVDCLLHSYMLPGLHRINFNASDLPSGIYFYRLQTENYSETKKMLLLR